MESNSNEAQLYMPNVAGVSNSQAVGLFSGRHHNLAQNLKPVGQNYCAVGDSFSNCGNWQGQTFKRKLSASHITNEKAAEALANGSPRNDGSCSVSPSASCSSAPFSAPTKRLCVSKSPLRENSNDSHLVQSTHPPSSPCRNSNTPTFADDAMNEAVCSSDLNTACLPKVVSEPSFLNQPDVMKMNADKLDSTIDHVLALARGDDPCEEVFVLPCRSREFVPVPSPLNQGSTPNSSLNMSPSSPSDSPKLFQLSPAFSATPSSNSLIAAPHQYPKYVTEQQQGNNHIIKQQFSYECVTRNQPAENRKEPFRTPSAAVNSSQCVRQNPNVAMLLKPNLSENLQSLPLIQPVVFTTCAQYSTAAGRQVNSNSSRNFEQRPIFSKVPATVIEANAPLTDSLKKPPVFPAGLMMCMSQRQVNEPTHAVFSASHMPAQLPHPSNQSGFQDTITCDSIAVKSFQSCSSLQTLSCPDINGVPHVLSAIKKKPQTITSPVHMTIHNAPAPNAKKRSNPSVSKRRKSVQNLPLSSTKMAVSNSNSSNSNMDYSQVFSQKQSPVIQETLSKLMSFDCKSFLSDPAMKPFPSALPPLAAQSLPLLSTTEEESWINLCGFKYKRNNLAIRLRKPPFSEGSKFCELSDLYLTQRLPPTHTKPVLEAKVEKAQSSEFDRICPSPEQVTMDNQLSTFFSGIRQKGCLSMKPESTLGSDSPPLLHMLSHSSSLPNVSSSDRCTPPLPLCHIPNTSLLRTPIASRRRNESLTPTEVKSYTQHAETKSENKHHSANGGSESPSIDSETGEVVGGHRPKLLVLSASSDQPTKENKLQITFTISPTMTVNIPKVVQLIADLFDIEKDSVNCEITGSGGQISFHQNKMQSEGVVHDLELKLRQHFTQLSIRVDSSQKASDMSTELVSSFNAANINGLSQSTTTLVSPKGKVGEEAEVMQALLRPIKHKEELVNVPLLVAARSSNKEHCRNCNALVPNCSGIKRKLDEIVTLNNVVLNVDNGYHISDDYVFCGSSCLQKFSTFLLACFHNDDDPTQFQSNIDSQDPAQSHSGATVGSHQSETRYQLVFGNLPWMNPVLLQNLSTRSLKSQISSRRNFALSAPSGKRKVSPKQKRWRDLRWRAYKGDPQQWRKSVDEAKKTVTTVLSVFKNPKLVDNRPCILCNSKGDASEETCGRLLCVDVGRWIHLNCALWCYEIYESVSGSLHNVDECIKRALETTCTFCNMPGAGLPCYNPRCSFVYHVPCAIGIECMFFTDRGMYCPTHQPKDSHPMQLPSLVVNRKVYLTRDESSQVANVIHEESREHRVRIGSLTLHSIGQLLPHQIESGYFHTPRYIYPVHFSSSRVHWSTRCPFRRSLYHCKILEKDARPLFQVTVTDSDMPDVIFQAGTCDGVWKKILAEIQNLRCQSNLVQLFSNHMKGEDLFGLSEPHIVRAIESLPGVDSLIDYAFNFGRLQLISEMPLAVNPSGCARSEPNLRTYLRRKRAFVSPHEKSHSIGSHHLSPAPSFANIRRVSSSGLDISSWARGSLGDSAPKNNLSSKSQQYRRLKMEFPSNVVFGRSRIQGFGMFAARNLEQNTIVIEYIGELIRLELANKREKEYEARNRGIYMFRLEDDTVIDATMCGGPARYINHSCQPNCFTEYVNFNDEGHIVIITKRKIDKGEELTYDYQFDLEDRTSKLPCLCGAVGCRKWMN